MKYTLLLLLIHTQLMATELENNGTLSSEIFRRGKATVKNAIVTAKISLEARRVFGSYFHDLKKNQDKPHISKIIGKVEDKKVLELCFSPFVYICSLNIHFKFKDFDSKSKKINYFVMDNEKNMAMKSFEIKRKVQINKELTPQQSIEKEVLKINSKVWSLTTVEDVIEELYGNKSLKVFKANNKNYRIESSCKRNDGYSYKYTECKKEKAIQYIRTSVFIKFDSSKELDSIVVFYTGKRYPLQAIYKIPPQSIPYIGVKYSFEKSGEIIIIARGKDGKVYQSKPFEINVLNASATEDERVSMLFSIK